jgi:hypothetical protein
MFFNRAILTNSLFFALMLMGSLICEPVRAQCFVTVNIGCDWSMHDDCQPGLESPCNGKNANDSCGTEFEFDSSSFDWVDVSLTGQQGWVYYDDKNCGRYKSCTCLGAGPLQCTPSAVWQTAWQSEYISIGVWCEY